MGEQPRQIRGRPKGGQWRARQRRESNVTLDTPTAWPTIAYEVQWWEPPAELSARRRERERGEYRSAIPAAISTHTPAIPTDIAAHAEEATVALARFDAEADRVLPAREIAPIQSILLRTESAASSHIEHITAGARQLAQAALGEEASTNAHLVDANVRAMTAATALASAVTVENVLAMHAQLLGAQRHANPGQWRARPVWIAGDDVRGGPLTASFVPPHHVRIPDAMDDLVAFASRDGIPALTHAALAHAQFETIHPFNDGNGRVGRALIHSMLHRAGITSRITVPISAGLLASQDRYIAALSSYQDGDLVPIVSEVSEAAIRATVEGRRLLGALSEVRQRWQNLDVGRGGSATQRLPDVLLGQPVVNVRYVENKLEVAYNTAHKAIDAFERAGVLRSAIVGRRRNRVWYAPEVTDALDDFADRAQRREF